MPICEVTVASGDTPRGGLCIVISAQGSWSLLRIAKIPGGSKEPEGPEVGALVSLDLG